MAFPFTVKAYPFVARAFPSVIEAYPFTTEAFGLASFVVDPSSTTEAFGLAFVTDPSSIDWASITITRGTRPVHNFLTAAYFNNKNYYK